MLPHDFGRVPSRFKLPICSDVSCTMLPHASGRVPVSSGLATGTFDACPAFDGIGGPSKSRFWRCGRAPWRGSPFHDGSTPDRGVEYHC